MSDVLKLDYEKIVAVGNRLQDLGNSGETGGINSSARRLFNIADGKNYSNPGFLNLTELSAEFVQNSNIVVGKVEKMGEQFISAANAIKSGDLAAANQCFKDAYRVDELKFDKDIKSWYENTTYGYSVVKEAYGVVDSAADSTGLKQTIKASKFLKGIKTAAESSEVVSKILAKGGKIGKILPIVDAILGVNDVFDGANGFYNETNKNMEEYKKTGDLPDFIGNQTATTLNNGINVVAGGLAVAGGIAAGIAFFGTMPAWGPPVLAAGAVAGIGWLVNEGTGWLTGKKAGDWVGDGVRAVGDFADNVAKGIGRLFSW